MAWAIFSDAQFQAIREISESTMLAIRNLPSKFTCSNGEVCRGHHARALIWIKCLFEPG